VLTKFWKVISKSQVLNMKKNAETYSWTLTVRVCVCVVGCVCVRAVGAFQSEALRVPEHCQFDHIHESSNCKTYEAWNKTTSEACTARHGAKLHRFSVLQPCAIDGFNGAEFVCCPSQGCHSVTRIIGDMQGGPKILTHVVRVTTSSNIDLFSNFFSLSESGDNW